MPHSLTRRRTTAPDHPVAPRDRAASHQSGQAGPRFGPEGNLRGL